MTENEVETLKAWIGREERKSEHLTVVLIERLKATMGPSLARIKGEAPLGIHWCMTQPAIAAGRLGVDGHPARGGFLPPVPLPQRMWAGGKLAFLAPLRVGEEVARISRIANIARKQGRSGELVVVTVNHDILCGGTASPPRSRQRLQPERNQWRRQYRRVDRRQRWSSRDAGNCDGSKHRELKNDASFIAPTLCTPGVLALAPCMPGGEQGPDRAFPTSPHSPA
jgi:hypothetical protein